MESKITLNLEIFESDQIQGRIYNPSNSVVVAFSGYLELMAALENFLEELR